MKQTHTKQVEEVMKGCGKKSCGYRNVRIRIPINYWQGIDKPNRVMSTQVERKLILCPSCKAILKGMQTAIQNELDFLERLMSTEFIEGEYDGTESSEIKFILNRITNCKNALAKIKEGKRTT